MDCLFCKIVSRKIDSNVIFENEEILAFDDIRPQSPCHKLIIPKQHISTLNDLNEENANLVGSMIIVAKQLAEKYEVATDGYRLVFNCNQKGGQEVYHIHLHLLGGRQMFWPPG
ncbi:MAG: histidine triad nucleotide-binding protein [Gammaproteobacteria bacterium]|nr:histidine triad nucleotide-binding protein [Gammaproteobacteria bacterium]